eukprot:4047930-Pleurochrysis_carterae.AAC.1
MNCVSVRQQRCPLESRPDTPKSGGSCMLRYIWLVIAMRAAERKEGEKRSAANNQQGHQKTPAMIKAVLTDALRGTPGQTAPRGGCTDVGLHTGGLPRNTMWPL